MDAPVLVTARDFGNPAPPYEPPPEPAAPQCVHAGRVATLERAALALSARVEALEAKIGALTALVIPEHPTRSFLARVLAVVRGWL
jgi:hypothetical protein